MTKYNINWSDYFQLLMSGRVQALSQYLNPVLGVFRLKYHDV